MSTKSFNTVTSFFATILVLASGLPARALQSLPADAPLPSTLPGLVSRRIQLDLADRLNVSAQDIVVGAAIPQTWGDDCLMLGGNDEVCARGQKKGWRVEVKSPQQTWIYRSDRTANRLRLEAHTSNRTEFSANLSQTLLEKISQQVQTPAEYLQILQVQTADWDSCMGIARPNADANAECYFSNTPGFKILVKDATNDLIDGPPILTSSAIRQLRKEWVYHVSADAAQVVQNDTASDLKGRTQTLLRGDSNAIAPLDNTVIFQAISDVSVSSQEITTTLTEDGSLTIEFVDYSRHADQSEINPDPILIQIPAEEVAAFATTLEQQQFSNLNRMAYGNEDRSTAIDGSLTVRTPDTTVRISAPTKDLPQGLRTVMQAWASITP